MHCHCVFSWKINSSKHYFLKIRTGTVPSRGLAAPTGGGFFWSAVCEHSTILRWWHFESLARFYRVSKLSVVALGAFAECLPKRRFYALRSKSIQFYGYSNIEYTYIFAPKSPLRGTLEKTIFTLVSYKCKGDTVLVKFQFGLIKK
jgi:hypothetical protein